MNEDDFHKSYLFMFTCVGCSRVSAAISFGKALGIGNCDIDDRHGPFCGERSVGHLVHGHTGFQARTQVRLEIESGMVFIVLKFYCFFPAILAIPDGQVAGPHVANPMVHYPTIGIQIFY